MIVIERIGSEDPKWKEYRLDTRGELDIVATKAYSYIQYVHDSAFHSDIFNLTTKEKLTHLALHLAKYTSNFLLYENKTLYYKSLIDTFIICTSMVNAMKFRLSEIIERALHESKNGIFINDFELKAYIVNVATIAKACESLDHIEDYNVHDNVRQALISIFGIVIRAFTVSNLKAKYNLAELFELAIIRLLNVEKQHPFFDEIKMEQNKKLIDLIIDPNTLVYSSLIHPPVFKTFNTELLAEYLKW